MARKQVKSKVSSTQSSKEAKECADKRVHETRDASRALKRARLDEVVPRDKPLQSSLISSLLTSPSRLLSHDKIGASDPESPLQARVQRQDLCLATNMTPANFSRPQPRVRPAYRDSPCDLRDKQITLRSHVPMFRSSAVVVSDVLHFMVEVTLENETISRKYLKESFGDSRAETLAHADCKVENSCVDLRAHREEMNAIIKAADVRLKLHPLGLEYVPNKHIAVVLCGKVMTSFSLEEHGYSVAKELAEQELAGRRRKARRAPL